jgi:2,4-dienoyl-CoA reductase-like NADH-dependent reductase (Old Yellow Enzyme family)
MRSGQKACAPAQAGRTCVHIAGVTFTTDRPGGLTTPIEQRPMLFRPIELRGVTARNRIMLGPMSQYLAIDGNVTDWHLVHLGQFALGGAGIVFCEETAVEARGRRTHHCAGIYTDEHVRSYRRIAAFIKQMGALPGIQLGHSGRRGSVRPPWEGRAPLTTSDIAKGRAPWDLVSASAIAHGPDRPVPAALDLAEIRAEIATWGDAARRAADAGFDVIEIHGAHGYLLNQFLSPVGNKRADAYGGDLEGRMRFVLELAESVRAGFPKDRPLFFRMSIVDGKGGHWDVDDSVVLAKALHQRGVDVIDCSCGGMTGDSSLPAVARVVPGYNVIYSDHVRREAGVPTAVVGLITEPAQAEAILQAGQADIIAIAREMLCDPYWPVHAAKALGLPDWLDLLPENYAFRLFPREEDRRLGKAEQTYEVPFRRKK